MGRAKALKLNIVTNLLHELVVLISGLILPQLILRHFGSSCNGLVSSITQFLGFSVILRAGIGGSVRAALYKPLAENDKELLDGIMVSTDNHMKKIGAVLGALILSFSFIYPFIVIDEYSWFFAFSMVLIIGAASFADNMFSIKCKILMQADQKYYILSIVSTITRIITLVISVIFINLFDSILIVKLGALLVVPLSPLILNYYVKKKYNINWKAKPVDKAIKERWSAFFQQVAIVLNENIALVLLTFLVPLKEVSVYSIYKIIVSNMRTVALSFTSGLNSTFGNIMACGEKDALKKIFMFIEWSIFLIAGLLLSVTCVMLPDFIKLYTTSVNDVNYVRQTLAILIVIPAIIKCIRIPYQMIVEAAGKFKQTRNGAALEVVLNIVLSTVFAVKYGLNGVILGSVISSLIRTVEYAVFSMKNLLNISVMHIVKHFLIVTSTIAACIIIGKYVNCFEVSNYLTWALSAALVTATSGAIMLVVSLIFYKEQLLYLLNRWKGKLLKK